MSLVKQIKERLGVLNYAQSFIPIQNNRGISLIAPGSNSTTCAYYDNWFYDFKQCVGGDIIDLVALTKCNGDRGNAIKHLAEKLNLSYDHNDNKWQEETQQLCNFIQKCHEELTIEHKEYILSRKITQETISRLKLGSIQKNRIVIPYWKNNYICYYITRGENPKYKKALISDYNENIIWGLHTLNRNQDKLYVCEGAFDAITLDQEGYSVVASMGGHFNKSQQIAIKDICKMFKEIILAFDDDDAGKVFTKTLAEMLVSCNIKFKIISNYNGHKDLSSFYESGGKPEYLKTENGFSFIFKLFTEKEDIKNFIRKVGKFLDKIDMGEFYREVKETNIIDPQLLKDIFNEAIKPPCEDFSTQSILKEHIIKYSEPLGFYEYFDGKWNSIPDTQIKKYIGDELGKFKTGSKLNSIFNLIKAETLYKDMFNMQPYINFKNGVLELASGELKPHSPTYMMTHQVPYNYDMHEICPEWQQFILEISNMDEKKAILLQEVCGYILFNNNQLQKAIFLLGEGANGKSVFLNVLSEIFPKEAITHIEMSGLAEPFQRIQLTNSFLNISSESKSSFEDAETVFKQAVVGDSINGCFKNKDFISFIPRTKFFTACNRFINTKDTTEGFLRRLLFIKFSVKFVEEPTNSTERKANKTIYDKLLTERTGIFNWCYEGYKKLKQNLCFTELEEQKQTMDDYMNLIDPIFAFLKEILIATGNNITFIDKETLYSEYKEWCYNCTHLPQSKNKFLQNMKHTSHLRNIRIYEQSRSGRRGFVLEKIA